MGRTGACGTPTSGAPGTRAETGSLTSPVARPTMAPMDDNELGIDQAHLDRLREAAEQEAGGGEGLAIRIDYVVLKNECGYCGAAAEVIRVSQSAAGNLAVMTLCEQHANGESRQACEKEGFIPVAPGSTFLNPTIFGDVPDEARATPFYLQEKPEETN